MTEIFFSNTSESFLVVLEAIDSDFLAEENATVDDPDLLGFLKNLKNSDHKYSIKNLKSIKAWKKNPVRDEPLGFVHIHDYDKDSSSKFRCLW